MVQNREWPKENKEIIDQVAELLKRMQAGDLGAFDELYQLTNRFVQFTVRKQLSDYDDWEDRQIAKYEAMCDRYDAQ